MLKFSLLIILFPMTLWANTPVITEAMLGSFELVERNAAPAKYLTCDAALPIVIDEYDSTLKIQGMTGDSPLSFEDIDTGVINVGAHSTRASQRQTLTVVDDANELTIESQHRRCPEWTGHVLCWSESWRTTQTITYAFDDKNNVTSVTIGYHPFQQFPEEVCQYQPMNQE